MTESEFLVLMEEKGFTKTGRSEYAPDMDDAMHGHDFAFEALVLEGQFILTTESGSTTISPGGTWSLAAGVQHSEKVIGPSAVKFVYGLP